MSQPPFIEENTYQNIITPYIAQYANTSSDNTKKNLVLIGILLIPTADHHAIVKMIGQPIKINNAIIVLDQVSPHVRAQNNMR